MVTWRTTSRLRGCGEFFSAFLSTRSVVATESDDGGTITTAEEVGSLSTITGASSCAGSVSACFTVSAWLLLLASADLWANQKRTSVMLSVVPLLTQAVITHLRFGAMVIVNRVPLSLSVSFPLGRFFRCRSIRH